MARSASPLSRRLATLAIVSAASAAGVSCTRQGEPELRIGIVVLSSGPLAPILGVSGQRGAELAVAELNEAGGVMIGGVMHRVVLRVRPSEPRPDAAATAVGALINIDSVDAVVAPLTSVLAAPAAGVAQAAHVVFIAPMASNPSVTAERDFAFRLAFSDAFQGELLATFAYDSLGYVQFLSKKYPEAKQNLQQAYNLANAGNNFRAMLIAIIHLGQVQAAMGEKDAAKLTLRDAQNLALQVPIVAREFEAEMAELVKAVE